MTAKALIDSNTHADPYDPAEKTADERSQSKDDHRRSCKGLGPPLGYHATTMPGETVQTVSDDDTQVA